MKPVRHSSIQSTWDQGLEIFKVTNGREVFSLGDATTLVWPLIDNHRGVETIIAELKDRVPKDVVLGILRNLEKEKLIRMIREDFRDEVLDLYSFHHARFQFKTPSLMSGSAGASLYFLSEGLRRNDDSLILKAREGLMSALSGIQFVSGAASFYEGPLGILWLENLWQNKTGERLIERKTLKPYLRSYIELHRKLPPGRFEFLYGTSGWSLAGEICDRSILKDMASVMVRQIEDSLEPSVFGAVLRGVESLEHFHDPDIGRAISTSPGFLHGIAGALTALIVLRESGVLEKKDNDLINGLTETLLSLDEKLPIPRTFEAPHLHDRQDWCHGDGGVALTLLLIGERELGIRMLKRALRGSTDKGDVGLCHGLGGKLAMATVARELSGGGFQREIREKFLSLEKLSGGINPDFMLPHRPLIVTAIGAVISMNAVEDPDLISFFFPN